jgi:hypothetical protein
MGRGLWSGCGGAGEPVAPAVRMRGRSHASAGGRIVVVDVRRGVVLLELILGAAATVAVKDGGVVVLVGVVVGLMLELAGGVAQVAVRDVIVVVVVEHRRMAVLFANITQHLLVDASVRQDSPPGSAGASPPGGGGRRAARRVTQRFAEPHVASAG